MENAYETRIVWESSTSLAAAQIVTRDSVGDLPRERLEAQSGKAAADGAEIQNAPQTRQPAKARSRRVKMCCRKQAEIAASLMRRVQKGEFVVFKNLVVLVPQGPATVDAEPDTPDRR